MLALLGLGGDLDRGLVRALAFDALGVGATVFLPVSFELDTLRRYFRALSKLAAAEDFAAASVLGAATEQRFTIMLLPVERCLTADVFELHTLVSVELSS